MSNTEKMLEAAKRALYGNYRPAPIVLSHGKGCEVFDVDGRRWLDLTAGVAVCAVGHAHPKLVKAIADQAARAMHVSNYFYNDQNILLAERLGKLSGMDRAFFCNSGAEANEALLKLARHHFYAKGDTKRVRIVAFLNAFHGRTMGSLSMTGTAKYREGFGDLGNVTHVPYGDLAAAKAALGPDVAAIIVEAVQGEGGVLPAPAGFLEGLSELARANGSLFFMDEVQTGMGRLGAWFGFQRTSVKPDAISLAKGLGGGFPIGAMLTTEALGGALPPGTHGSTFGGNPLACAAALSVIDILTEENLVASAKSKGAHLDRLLQAAVSAIPNVCESARGEGLLRGLVMKQGFVARDVLPKLAEAGLLLTAAGERVLRFSPALTVTEAELEEGVSKMRSVLEQLARAAA